MVNGWKTIKWFIGQGKAIEGQILKDCGSFVYGVERAKEEFKVYLVAKERVIVMECNYCRLQRIKREAKGKARVYVVPSVRYPGYDIFVVPHGEKLDKRTPDEGGKHWKCWFMGLPERCVCDE